MQNIARKHRVAACHCRSHETRLADSRLHLSWGTGMQGPRSPSVAAEERGRKKREWITLSGNGPLLRAARVKQQAHREQGTLIKGFVWCLQEVNRDRKVRGWALCVRVRVCV